MSNQYIPHEKLIKIKPIDLLKKEYAPVQEMSSVDEKELINSQLEQAKQELQMVKQEQELLIQQTKTMIINEKKAWENEKQTITETAQKEGYEQGFKLGKEEGYSQYKDALEQVNQLSETAQKDYFKTIEQSDMEILNIAIHVAEKILTNQLREKPENFLPIVTTAIDELKDKSSLVIYVHPKNYEMIIKQKDELLQILENDPNLLIRVQESLPENGCVIEHPFGRIDLGIDSQLSQIRKTLNEFVVEHKP